MQIKKIKINGEGLKGISVTYVKPEEKGGRTFSTDVVEEKRYPIHLGLETKFKELREYHNDICGLLAGKLGENEVKYIVNNTDIIGLSLGNDWFLLSAKVNTFADKKIAISTPKIDLSDEYHAYDKVQKLIEEILTEVADYMSGAKKATDEDFGRRVIERELKRGKETISMDEFDAMSEEQKKVFCTGYLEKVCGSLVSHTDDLIIEEENSTIVELQRVG